MNNIMNFDNYYIDNILLKNNPIINPDKKTVSKVLKANDDNFSELLFKFLTSNEEIMTILYFRYLSIIIPTKEDVFFYRKNAGKSTPCHFYFRILDELKPETGLFNKKNIYINKLSEYIKSKDIPSPEWDVNKDAGPRLLNFYSKIININSSNKLKSLICRIMNSKLISYDRITILTDLKEYYDQIIVMIHLIVDYGSDEVDIDKIINSVDVFINDKLDYYTNPKYLDEQCKLNILNCFK